MTVNRQRTQELAGGALARAAELGGYLTTGKRHRRQTFAFDGRTYHYHSALYNTTWINERTVELPIVIDAMGRRSGSRILELGNVLAHYGASRHTVVDKYESARDVHNVDVVDFSDEQGFDLIVSISTVEHIGFDEDVKDPDKPARAMRHLAGMLRPGGEGLVTIPLGYNPTLDERLLGADPAFGELCGLRRVSADNRWEQMSIQSLRETRYGTPYPSANGLIVARLQPVA
jgi:SAM-dependent methyltransferase